MQTKSTIRRGRDQSILDYLWSKIDRAAGPDACWPWTGCRMQKGYGAVGYQGRTYNAHSLLFTLLDGPLKPGDCVRHTCDNPPCCNPAHLLRGSHHDNVRDAVERRLFKHGAEHYQTTLTADQVREIRRRHASRDVATSHGHTAAHDPNGMQSLAAEYGVSPTTIHAIVHRHTWKHLDS